MKPKKTLFRHLPLAAISLTLCLPPTYAAATYYWDTTTTGTWGSPGGNWSNNAASGGTTGTVPTSADSVVFNQSLVNGATISQMDAAYTVVGVTFSNTGTTLINSDSSTSRTLTLGTGGISVSSGAGAVTFGSSGAPVTLSNSSNGALNLTNSSTSLVTYNGAISTTNNSVVLAGSGAQVFNSTITGTGVGGLSIAGAGIYTFNDIISSTGTGFTSLTSAAAGATLIIGKAGALNNLNTNTASVNIQSSGNYDILTSGSAITIVNTPTFNGSQSFTVGKIVSANTRIINSSITGGGTLTISGYDTGSVTSGVSTLGGSGNTVLNSIINTNALTITNTGTTTFAGANTLSGSVTLGTNLGVSSTLRFTNAAAIQSIPSIKTTSNNTLQGLAYSAGGVMTYTGSAPSLDMSANTGSGFTLNVSLDGFNQSFSSLYLGQKNHIRVSNSATSGTPALSVTGGTTVGSTTAGQASVLNSVGSAAISLNTVTTATVASGGPFTQILVLAGDSTGSNQITGTMTESSGSGATGSLLSLEKAGPGTWTLGGASNSFTGTTKISGGKLVLDYSTNNNTKLADGAALSLLGGTLEIKGGSHTEVVASTTINTGGNFVKRNTGTSVLQMGVITFTGGAVDFGTASIATTTNSNTNGILSQKATVAGANFAMVDAAATNHNIVAYDYVTNGSTGYTGGAMSANTNYALTANGASTLSGSQGAASNTLKIANTATGSLDVAANTLTTGAILFAGSANYQITTSGVGKIVNTLLHNYGSGTLTLGALGVDLQQYGTGKTILSAAAAGDYGLTVNGGAVQFSDNLQIGTNVSAKAITLNTGTLIADTTGGSIALNSGGSNSRTIVTGLGGGTLDVIGGNSLTVTGVISGNNTSGSEFYSSQITYGSASSNGKIILSGANTYKGASILAGGIVQANVADVAGTSGAFGAFGTAATFHDSLISFTGGTLQYGSGITTDYSNRIKNSTSAIKIDTNNNSGANVTYAGVLDSSNTGGLIYNNTTATGGSNNNGKLILSAANTFTGGLHIQGTGQLVLAAAGAAGANTIYLESTQDTTATTLSVSASQAISNPIMMDSTTGREHIVFSGSANSSLAGGITINGSGANSLVVENNQTVGGTLTLSGGISAPNYANSVSLRGNSTGGGFVNGVVTMSSSGTMDVRSNWTFNTVGSTWGLTQLVGSGNITLAADNALATGARVTWIANTTTVALDLNGYNQSVAGLTSSDAIPTANTSNKITNNALSSGNNSTLTLAGLSTDYTFYGVVSDGANKTTALVMNSSGKTQTLVGVNTYSGATTITAGKLSIGSTGTINSTSGVTIGTASTSAAADFNYNSSNALSQSVSFASGSTGGKLSGSGTITSAVTVSSGNTLAPGNSIGTLSFGTGLTLAGTYSVELGTVNADPALSLSDRAAVTGALTVGGNLTLVDNANANSQGSASAGAYRIATYTTNLSGTFSSITNPLSSTLHEKVVYGPASGGGSVDLNLYRLATANTISTPLALGNVRVGGTLGQNLTIQNTATNDGFSEGLNASGGSLTGSATTSGSITNLAAGSTDNSSLSVGLSTGTAGAKTGTVLIGLNSNGSGTSGYGTTALTGQTITVNGGVFNPAVANTLATPVTLTNVRVGGTFGTSALSISNTATVVAGYNEGLNATQGSTTGSASVSGTNISNLAAGSSLSTISMGLGAADTSSAGVKTGTVAIGFASNGTNSGLTNLTLSGQTVTVNGSVFNPAVADTIASVSVGKTRVGGTLSGTAALTISNTAPSGAFTEGLNATVGSVSGASGSGLITNLAGGSSNTSSISLGLVGADCTTAGLKTGSVTINLASSGANSGLSDLGLASQTVGVSGLVYDYADAVFSKTTGTGSFSGGGSSYSLDFGTGLALNTTYTATIQLANYLLSSYQDNLGGSYGSLPSSEFASGVEGTSIASLVAGTANTFTITFNTGSTGNFSDTLTFTGASQQSGLSDATLGAFTINLTANAVPEPDVSTLIGGIGMLLLLRRRR